MFGRKLLFPTGSGFKLPLAIISDKHKLHDIIAVKGRFYSINCVPGMVRPSTGKKYVNISAVSSSKFVASVRTKNGGTQGIIIYAIWLA